MLANEDAKGINSNADSKNDMAESQSDEMIEGGIITKEKEWFKSAKTE